MKLKSELVKEILEIIPQSDQERLDITERKLGKMTKPGLESLLKIWKRKTETI